MKKGFTLVETLIYIALFTILIGAGFSTAYYLIQDGESLSSKTVTNSELNFVLQKLDWASTGASSFEVISPSELKINRYSSPAIVSFRLDAGTTTKYIQINEGSGWTSLTTVNVEVSDLNFQTISGTPSGIIVSMTLDGISATTTKYTRQ